MAETILLLGKQDFCRVWRNDTGKGIKMSGFEFAKRNANNKQEMEQILARSIFSYGLNGSSDILGILNTGQLLCIEIKSGNARQSATQKNFEAMITRFGGVYIVARSPENALDSVKHFLS